MRYFFRNIFTQSLCAFAALFFILSCSSTGNNKTVDGIAPDSARADSALRIQYKVDFPLGVIIPRVVCSELRKNPSLDHPDKANDSVTYALYLPKNYSTDKKYPVVFFFDSHGSGSLPIEMYKGLAEKYGYILAGSNDSQNGIPWEQNRESIKIFMKDVHARFSLDDKRIYTWGFSGGSRVASSVAIFAGGINCVVGMGAGLPSLTEPIHNRFDYIGFAGNEDFNMNEMAALNASMDKSPIRHQLIIFSGKHEWAPAAIAEDAFFWLEINAMRSLLIPKNDSLINEFINKSKVELKDLEKTKKVYEELLLCRKVNNYIDVMADHQEFIIQADELSRSEAFKKDSTKRAAIAKEELTFQQTYKNNFALKDLTWWASEIKSLNAKAKNKTDMEHSIMYKRLLNYLSLLAYMNSASAMQSSQFTYADTFLKIYEMVDPPNSEHQYLFAELYARKKDNEKAFSSLKNAVKLGFKDVSRMESDTFFVALRSASEYQKLKEVISQPAK